MMISLSRNSFARSQMCVLSLIDHFLIRSAQQEEQDIGKLVDMTQKFETMLQAMALNTARIEAPVQIVVKRPCIAMRYTKDPTKVWCSSNHDSLHVHSIQKLTIF